MKKTLLISGIIGFASLPVFPWGQKGHDTTAYIAEQHLTPATLDSITNILSGKSIVYYSNWLDNASHTTPYAYTKTWHYKNIDEGQLFEDAPLHPNGDIVTAINEQVNVLKNPMSSQDEKELALKIVVHLLGDIHQPMHLGHASDLGGNKWTISYFGKKSNLHSVWDSSLPESAHKWSYTEWQQQIDRATPEEEALILLDGEPSKWAKETFLISKQVYDATPQDSNLSYNEVAAWTPVIEECFLKGGLRLADILNTIYDPNYTPKNTFILQKCR